MYILTYIEWTIFNPSWLSQ